VESAGFSCDLLLVWGDLWSWRVSPFVEM